MAVPPPIDSIADARNLELPLLVRSGSRAYGLETEASDEDYVGLFIAPLRDFVSLGGLERGTVTGVKPDFTLHEIGKFCALALKGNPAILETLWNPDVLHRTAWGERLVGLRDRLIHRGSLEVYVGYAESQLKKMLAGKGLHSKGGTYNGKYGSHLLRLLHAGLSLAERREVMVRVPDDLRGTLMEVKEGRRSMGEVVEMAGPLLERLRALSASNGLPAEPARDEVETLVVEARLSRV